MSFASPRLAFNPYSNSWVQVNSRSVLRPSFRPSFRHDSDLGSVGGANITFGGAPPPASPYLITTDLPALNLFPTPALEPGELSLASMARRFRRLDAPVPPVTRSMATRVTRAATKKVAKKVLPTKITPARKKKIAAPIKKPAAPKHCAVAVNKRRPPANKTQAAVRVPKYTTAPIKRKPAQTKRQATAPNKRRPKAARVPTTNPTKKRAPAKRRSTNKKRKQQSKVAMAHEDIPSLMHRGADFDDDSDDEDEVPPLPPNDTMFDLAAFARNNEQVSTLSDLQNQLLRSATSQSPAYVARKKREETRFFQILGGDPHLCRLSEFVPNPEFSGEQIRRFYLEIKGMKTDTKKRVLNRCLVTYALLGLVRNDGNVMEPNTCQTSLKMLFSVFRVSLHRVLCTFRFVKPKPYRVLCTFRFV
jgi:hypothetical protein